MIELNKVSKGFGPIEVLREIDWEIDKGEFMSVRGKSGVGKTTLLKIIGLLERPDSGSVVFSGEEVSEMGDGERSNIRLHRIGFAFQSHNLISSLTVLENLELPLSMAGVGQEVRKKRARSLLDYFDLEGYEDRDPETLSGGERQRVTIARAVANRPDLVLADEPTSSLDEENSKLVIGLLEKINKGGTTLLMTTTDIHADLPTDADYTFTEGHLRKLEEK